MREICEAAPAEEKKYIEKVSNIFFRSHFFFFASATFALCFRRKSFGRDVSEAWGKFEAIFFALCGIFVLSKQTSTSAVRVGGWEWKSGRLNQRSNNIKFRLKNEDWAGRMEELAIEKNCTLPCSKSWLLERLKNWIFQFLLPSLASQTELWMSLERGIEFNFPDPLLLARLLDGKIHCDWFNKTFS